MNEKRFILQVKAALASIILVQAICDPSVDSGHMFFCRKLCDGSLRKPLFVADFHSRVWRASFLQIYPEAPCIFRRDHLNP